MLESYTEQVRGLIAGGADVLLIETQQDLLVIKCAIAAASSVCICGGGASGCRSWCRRRSTLNGGQNMLTGSRAGFGARRNVYARVRRGRCAGGELRVRSAGTYRDGPIHRSKNWPRLVSALPNAGTCRSWSTARAFSR